MNLDRLSRVHAVSFRETEMSRTLLYAPVAIHDGEICPRSEVTIVCLKGEDLIILWIYEESYYSCLSAFAGFFTAHHSPGSSHSLISMKKSCQSL